MLVLPQSVVQKCNASTTSTHGVAVRLSDVYSFPLSITTSYEAYPVGYSASVGPYEYNRVLVPPPTAGGLETTKSSQTGTATISQNAAKTAYVGNSQTSETYDWLDGQGVSQTTFEHGIHIFY